MSKWKTVKLGDVCEIQRNSITPNKIKPGTKYLGLENIESGGLILSYQVLELGEIASNKFHFTDEHILYGKLRPYLAKIASPEFVGVCSTDILPIYPSNKILKSYLLHFLRQKHQVNHVSSQSSGANLPRISTKILEQIEIPLPPLDEQKRIAAILDQADELRRKRQHAITRLNQLSQTIFYDMFGDPVTNPKGWEISQFGSLVTNEDGMRIPIKQNDRSQMRKTYPYYGASGVIDFVESFIFSGERLLIGEDGANLISRNSPLAFMAKGEFWVNNHAHVLANNGKANLRFLEQFIENINVTIYTSGSAQPKLTQANLNKISVPTPPLYLQNKYESLINNLENKLSFYNKSLEHFNALFASLQHKAFRGEL